MRRFHLSICLASLTLLFSACSVAELTTPKQTQLNESLPKVQSLKSISDLSNVAFEWEPLYSENIQGFYLYRSSEKEPQMKLVATIKDKFQTHYVDTKLESGTKYQYMMKTFNEQGHFSEEGQVIEIATQPRPEPLAFVQAITNLPERIKLIWRPHTDLRVNAYIIEKKKVEDKKFAKIGEVKNRLSAEFIDEVKANENFLYRVSALTFDGVQSEPSEVLNSTSKALPPEITHLSASNDLNGKIMLSWDAPVYEDFSYFKIYATSSSFLPFTLLAKTDKNSYEDIVQGAGESKQYKITMVDKDGLESPMPKKGVEGKTLGLPASPSIILAQITSEGIVLEWADNDNRAVEYEVKRYGGDQNAIFKGIKEKRLRDIKALAGVEYSYEVIAIDELGQRSAPSSKVKAAQ
ncbi:fibronectin type III domain-containing protein [Campylobacter upsaliensis]|uniref:fibronectin type III domain-containing protein n=1 Tax=Campylobacter upsaliensis TaxID=28080 RepID=UPI000554C24B|nr:fibronectin type III domain-containing protein [Campylobacter upsaliensis]EAB5281710.1 fibronectin type III domain-containing protein [Campylobacter upsaliensis]EAH4720430.1 fibronectin type III domain-containing protein [Campylobacter upsaliensis]EAH5546706.1 fibronectin type III domain-containing protein [Campylobacter upsaliensis]EAH5553136.1 fibronectin type III domain-containing protein [Campylobacter upsaliensis]EAH5675644.1 fibronectin type III domain-containing protein [Campylobacte